MTGPAACISTSVCNVPLSDGSACPSRDVSMLLRDPYALHCITHSLVRRLQELAEKETLPRVRGVSG